MRLSMLIKCENIVIQLHIYAYVIKVKSLLMTRHALEFIGLMMVIKCENIIIQLQSTSDQRKIEPKFFIYFQFLGSLIWDISAYIMKAKSLLMTRHTLSIMGLRMVLKCENVVIKHFTSTSNHRKVKPFMLML